uniref:L4 linker protein of V1 giant hemoglobin n=1 Tax=Lamellibrachia satsuma TaxID=104711 RepID=A0A125SXX8_LAMSA|nr:L4 linker protein of V1 giant hemoglobin [Lamellibrachia satsuma]
MRRLLALLAVVAAVRGLSTHIDENHVRDQDYPFELRKGATPEPAARETAISSIELELSADANDLRMNELQGQLDELEEEVHDLSSESIDMLPRLFYMRLLKGNGCGDNQFQCLMASDEVPQCISKLAVCDGVADCKNGNDEKESVCTNHTPLGSTWGGDLEWVGCAAHRSKRVYVVITRAWHEDFFPTRQKVAATLVFSWVENGQTMTNTEQVEGHYCYGGHALELNPMAGGHVSASIKCNFIDQTHCYGKIFNPATGTVCSRIILTRQ